MNYNFPNFTIENKHHGIIAGIDEAGRGPLCGPVVAACVILNQINYPKKINDSKKLSKKLRKEIFSELQISAQIGIGIVDEKIIDQINILLATKLAMQIAWNNLCQNYHIKTDIVLVDGNFIPNIDCKAEAVIKGDAKSLSIAAASIIAKETRDQIMFKLHNEFPYYGWDKNQGYPTKFHLENIKKFGICKYHRKSFAPIKTFFQNIQF